MKTADDKAMIWRQDFHRLTGRMFDLWHELEVLKLNLDRSLPPPTPDEPACQDKPRLHVVR
mgnify:CR=1 FL=1